MMTRKVMAVAAGACLGLSAAARAEVRVPLTVAEPCGDERFTECVTTGVPLLVGQAQDVKALRLVDAAGNDVAAQFRPLARWWRKDNSLRWVLVDFQTSLRPFQRKTFTLTDGRSADYPSPLKVDETPDAITVTTGTAQFVVNRKRFSLFERVRVDANGDGRYDETEEVVSPRPGAGSIVEDTYGLRYFAAEETQEVRVEEAGPVRVCVLAKGAHRDPERKGYSRGMYGHETRLHFYAGKNTVRVEHLLTNTFAEPTGSPTFEDHSLVFRINAEPAPSPNPDYEPKGVPLVMCRVYGAAPFLEELREADTIALYQDSNGTETWQVNPGVSSAQGKDLGQFRGYRIVRRRKGEETVLASGDHARGLVSLGGNRFGVVVVPRYFWQQFPKAIEVNFDGTVRIGVFPREYKAVHWLEDASAAGQDLWLHFYARGLTEPAKPQYPRDGETRSDWWSLTRDRPWPHQVADSLMPPLVALAPREHYAACGALADIGPYLPVPDETGFPLASTERLYLTTQSLKGNAFGWQVFGCRWEEYAGHSPWNYEPISSSNYLYMFVNTRHPSWLEMGWRRDRHFRDVRAYKIDGTKPFEANTWAEFSRRNVCEEWCSRKTLWPTGEEVQKYSQGRYPRAGWFLPNPEHNNLDELYDLYCLFGDVRALEGARNVAAVGGAFVATRAVDIGRNTGWCFRSLLRYRDLTASDECLPYVQRACDNFWKVGLKHRSAPTIPYDNSWFYSVFGRAAVLAYDVTGDERMRDLAIGLARGWAQPGGQNNVNAFAWDQTGQERYIKGFNIQGRVSLSGYFPACDGYLWLKPRADLVAPAAVTDLRGSAAGPGEVRLAWTAPGADFLDGTAAVYQVKWGDLPIVETAQDTGAVHFWAAENVSGEPKPARAGQPETFVIKELKPGIYHFALVSRDKSNNESPLSNVVKVEVR